MKTKAESRRDFIRTTTAAAAGALFMPPLLLRGGSVTKPAHRTFGRLGVEVTTLGLGGQASIQWTPEDVDPVKIILKAFDKGVNYFDTSNLYGPSQVNYGKAFSRMALVPDRAGYNEVLRRSIFLTTKTHLRYGKGGDNIQGVTNWTNGTTGSKTADDIRRSLSQMFGDGEGNYPKGAYLDMVLIHNLNTTEEVNALYEGLYDTDPKAERIGALAVLRDFRDGTNLTGLNPAEERLIRHVGFSGHFSAPVMMDMIRRDRDNLLDAMLVAINANDRLNFNMQHNVIPVATAKNMGVIGMKVFADGAMYTKHAGWTQNPTQVVRTVGTKEVPSAPLIRYTLTTPGVHTAIIGIGQISDDPSLCQLDQNFAAAQVASDALTQTDRREIESLTRAIKEGKTNYFQLNQPGIKAPDKPAANRQPGGEHRVEITWNTAFAGDEPIKNYSVMRDGVPVGTVPHKPQTGMLPFSFTDKPNDDKSHEYTIIARDVSGKTAVSEGRRI